MLAGIRMDSPIKEASTRKALSIRRCPAHGKESRHSSLGYDGDINVIDYIGIKLIFILVILNAVSFAFTLILGKSIDEAIEEAKSAHQNRADRAQ